MKFNVTLHESPLQGHLTVLKVAVCHTAGHYGGTMSMMFYICFAVGYEGKCKWSYGPSSVVKVVMCSRGGSASEVETHKNIDSVLHTKKYISSSQHIFH